MDKVDVIVIGGGPAGVTAALRARELGASVALIERGRLGGTCTNDGCAPTRVLAKAARLARDAEQFADYGLTPQRVAVDLPQLLARTQQIIYRLQEKKQLVAHLTEAGITVVAEAGPVAFTGPHTIALPDGRALSADKFILCVGGQPRRIPLPGAELALTHNDVWTLNHLPRSLAIVGAAATGCQLASIFNAFGARVYLLELAPRILPGEDEAVSQAVSEAFRARSVEVLAGIGGVERIEKVAEGLHLHYRRIGEARRLEVEAVLFAVGWIGNLEPLNLAAAGVETARGYIKVDDTLRTTAPHIFAAGDITGRMMLVQSASHEARIAAENALLGADRVESTAWHTIVPHGGFTDPEYGSVGLTEEKARAELGDDCAVAVIAYADLDRAVIDDRPEGFCKLIVSRESRQIVGAHVVGEQAVEIVQLAATGMAAGMTVEQLADLELAYPTFTAIMGLAARQLVRDLGLTPLAPAWRALSPLIRRLAEWERQA
jgi:dihydrolipoamide dehydrogenase